MKIFLSIITVTFNCEKIINKTIKSVLEQNCVNCEYIFIDGKSKDNTVAAINESMKIAEMPYELISEPDKGIYDAMNKGIARAKGEYVLFLNAGDCLKDGVLNKLEDQYSKNNDEPVLYGNSTNVYINSKSEELRIDYNPQKDIYHSKELNKGMCGLRHQAMLIPRKVFDVTGYYDLVYPVSADWDHMITCIENQISFQYVPVNFCDYRMDGVSTKPNLKERHLIRKKHHMYKTIDIQYLKECISIQNLLKVLFGQNFYNDILFKYHSFKSKKIGG